MNKNNVAGTSGISHADKGSHTFRMMTMLFLLAALIFLTVLIFIYTRNSSEFLKKEIVRKTQLATEQACNSVDIILEQVKEAASSLVGTIYPYLNNESDIAGQVEEYAEICRTMNEYINKHKISFLRLYVPDTKIYADQISMRYSFYSLKGLDKGRYSRAGIYWEETHEVKLGDGTLHKVISCINAVKKLSDYDELAGVLCADIETEQFYSIFADGTSSFENMYLVNEKGSILVSRDGEGRDDTVIEAKVMQRIQQEKDGCVEEEGIIYAFDQLEEADWYVVSINNQNGGYTLDTNVVVSIATVWLVVFLILLIFAGTMMYNINLNKTVKSINCAVNELEIGAAESLQKQEKKKSFREKLGQMGLKDLEKDVEQIVLSINDILEKQYQDKLAISEYRMEALQAQIKPHFLYNTLDAIKWMIMDESLKDAAWMVNALSRYLRMSINKGEQIVSLQEELTLMRTYLEIMQKRFKNKFEVIYDLEEGVLDCQIPKLSLQPLVENALLHGILHSEKPNLRLTVRVWSEDVSCVIQIEDNGCGMSKKQTEILNSAEITPGSGYGVVNVHNRLDIFDGGQCGFTIESKEEVGTCVTIELKRKYKK